jgi:hypothetical protein
MTEHAIGHFRGGRGQAPYIPDVLTTAYRERLGRQAFPPVIALRLLVAHNPLSYAFFSSTSGPL